MYVYTVRHCYVRVLAAIKQPLVLNLYLYLVTESEYSLIHLQHCLRIKKTSAEGSYFFSIWSWIFHTVLRSGLPINYSVIYETAGITNIRFKFHLTWRRSFLLITVTNRHLQVKPRRRQIHINCLFAEQAST